MEYLRLPSTGLRVILTGGRIQPRGETDSERLRDWAKDTQPGVGVRLRGLNGPLRVAGWGPSSTRYTCYGLSWGGQTTRRGGLRGHVLTRKLGRPSSNTGTPCLSGHRAGGGCHQQPPPDYLSLGWWLELRDGRLRGVTAIKLDRRTLALPLTPSGSPLESLS